MDCPLLLRPSHLNQAIGIVLVLSLGLPAAHSSTPTCPKSDSDASSYQQRTEMDRCEGVRRSKPIAAVGLRLTSYTIGQSSPQKMGRGGEVFNIQVPASPPGLPEPAVRVEAWKGNYIMEPLRFAPPIGGWKTFSWGAAVIQGQGIPSRQLRATAEMRPPGDAIQWLPVRFSPASSYTIVVSSNGSLEVSSVRIIGPNKEKILNCSGRTRIDQDLFCTWKAADLPTGNYRLIARSSDPGAPLLLNATLRHDPRWLSR
jgi:hypothetical protein